MEFICQNPECEKIFRPHRFIALRHPSKARCPDCNTRGLPTEKGRNQRKQIFSAINQANKEAAKTFG